MRSQGVDTAELSWAAGFFDGDGCFSTSETGHWAGAFIGCTDLSLIVRFQTAAGCGTVHETPIKPRAGCWSRKPQFTFRAYAGVLEIITRLWPFLGAAKRNQARGALRLLERRGLSIRRLDERPGPEARVRVAWAAGFFDAEGCFSFSRQTGPSATITNTDRDQLERFLDAIGVGKIYGPYRLKASDEFNRLPQYSFRATGLEKTQAVAAMLWFKLGSAEKKQASAVLAQVSTTCRRGHPKQPGHAGCGECTRDYWRVMRDAKGHTTGEPVAVYKVA